MVNHVGCFDASKENRSSLVHSGGVFCEVSYHQWGLAAGASLSLDLSLMGLVCWDSKVLVHEFLV